MGHISGTWKLLLCEYWRKSMIFGEKNMDLKRLKGRLKLRFLTEIGRFHCNQGEEVAHFAWFGEPWTWLGPKDSWFERRCLIGQVLSMTDSSKCCCWDYILGRPRENKGTNWKWRWKTEYEKNHPDRKFSSKWQTKRSWLVFSEDKNVMTCTTCVEFFQSDKISNPFIKRLLKLKGKGHGLNKLVWKFKWQ